jgi:hypothetical protein
MQRKLFFCKSWFAAKRRPTEVWTEAQARAAHIAKRPYTVLVDSMEAPFCTIDVAEKFVGIDFLDRKLRESLTYHFQEISPGQLFLTMATYREFEGDTDKVSSGTTYIFGPDGGVRIQREIFVPKHTVETSSSKVEVTSNYSTVPPFGDYDDLIRAERT